MSGSRTFNDYMKLSWTWFCIWLTTSLKSQHVLIWSKLILSLPNLGSNKMSVKCSSLQPCDGECVNERERVCVCLCVGGWVRVCVCVCVCVSWDKSILFRKEKNWIERSSLKVGIEFSNQVLHRWSIFWSLETEKSARPLEIVGRGPLCFPAQTSIYIWTSTVSYSQA